MKGTRLPTGRLVLLSLLGGARGGDKAEIRQVTVCARDDGSFAPAALRG